MEESLQRTSLYGFEMREPDLRRVEDRKTHDIKSLWQRSHEILALAVRGLKQTEIAEILNITPQTVSNTLNSELGQRKLSIMRRTRDEAAVETQNRITVLAEQALDVYQQIFENEDGQANIDLQKKAADTVVLELSGLRVPTKIQSHSVNTTATLEEIEALKERGKEAMRVAGMIVELPEEETGNENHCRHLEVSGDDEGSGDEGPDKGPDKKGGNGDNLA